MAPPEGRERAEQNGSRDRRKDEKHRDSSRSRRDYERERDGRDRDRDKDRGRDKGRERRDSREPRSSRGGQDDRDARRAGSATLPPRSVTPQPLRAGGPASALVADAARLVRQRLESDQRRANGGVGRPASASGSDDGRRSSEEAEEGEIGAQAEELPQAPPAKRRRHEPIVWRGKDGEPTTLGPGDVDARDEGEADGGGGEKQRGQDKGRVAFAAGVKGLSKSAAAPLAHAGSTTQLSALPQANLKSPSEQEELRGSRGAAGGRPRSAAEIAAAEIAEFRAMQTHLDYDPNAPAAVKASPSGSDDAGGAVAAEPVSKGSRSDAGSRGAVGSDAPLQVAQSTISSRWLEPDAADEDEVQKRHEEAEREEAALRELNAAEAADLAERPSPTEDVGRPDIESPPSADDEQPLSPMSLRNRKISMLQECRSVELFERLNRISEGTYGVVYRARDKATGAIVALKKVKMDKEKDGFPLTAVREINILLSFHHPSIVNVSEVVVGKSLDSVFMVMEFMEHDLKELMEEMKKPFTVAEVKCLMQQLLGAMDYLHDNWVLHRDLKSSNILYNNRGELKVCDFGLARQYGSPLKPYTHMVVTLWYRPPELLLGQKLYSTAVDMWSLGCIMGELLQKEVLFAGTSELNQIDRIFKVLGTPNDKIWPGYADLPNAKKLNFGMQPYNKLREKFPAPGTMDFDGRPRLSEAGFDLLTKLLALDPRKRISASAALAHPWFKENPRPQDKALMPTFPTHKDGSVNTKRRVHQPSPDPRLQDMRIDNLAHAKVASGIFS